MKRLLFGILALVISSDAFGWGQKGHDVVAYIAECHLTPDAAAKVYEVLDGHSPVYYANWLDNASHTPEYAYTKTWHYANIDKGYTFDTMPRCETGDVVQAVEDIVAALKSHSLDAAAESLYLKMLIHLVGDMHCPMHAGHLSDLGGNTVPVMFFSKPTKLHTVWDTDLVEAAHKWSYTEWRQQIDRLSDEAAAETIAGTPRDWFCQTAETCTDIYAATPSGTKISYDYIARYAPVVEQQLLRGGRRLAKLLNDIYGKTE